MRVGVERCARLRVAEATGNGAHVDSGCNQTSGSEVPGRVFQAQPLDSDRLSQGGEDRGRVVRPQRQRPARATREHKRVGVELGATGAPPLPRGGGVS